MSTLMAAIDIQSQVTAHLTVVIKSDTSLSCAAGTPHFSRTYTAVVPSGGGDRQDGCQDEIFCARLRSEAAEVNAQVAAALSEHSRQLLLAQVVLKTSAPCTPPDAGLLGQACLPKSSRLPLELHDGLDGEMRCVRVDAINQMNLQIYEAELAAAEQQVHVYTRC